MIRRWMAWWGLTENGPAMTWPANSDKVVLDRYTNDILRRRQQRREY